jgi:hypothetical protein
MGIEGLPSRLCVCGLTALITPKFLFGTLAVSFAFVVKKTQAPLEWDPNTKKIFHEVPLQVSLVPVQSPGQSWHPPWFQLHDELGFVCRMTTQSNQWEEVVQMIRKRRTIGI